MTFEIFYHEAVVEEDIPKISHPVQKQIKAAIEAKLTVAPEHFSKPLRRSLKGYRKMRVGDYRVILRIEGLKVKIFTIQHRSVVYKQSIRIYEV